VVIPDNRLKNLQKTRSRQNERTRPEIDRPDENGGDFVVIERFERAT
jgi:hypothetical protein